MSEFKIEKGVDIPLFGGRNRSVCPYPFLEMDFGDSFLISPLPEYLSRTRANVGMWAERISHESGKPFRIKTRTVEGGMRVWKVG